MPCQIVLCNVLVNFWPNSKVSFDLEKSYLVTGHTTIIKELDHPKTVCLECAEDKIVQISENQVQIVKGHLISKGLRISALASKKR